MAAKPSNRKRRGDDTPWTQKIKTVLGVLKDSPVLSSNRPVLREKLGVGATPRTLIHEEMCMKVYRYLGDWDSAQGAVLLVPSLVNGPYIMDLMPRHSLVGGLLERGVDVFMLEWDMPPVGIGGVDMEEVVVRLIPRAVRAARRRVGTRGSELTVLGQCLGATVAAVALALQPRLASGFVSLTAPYDFAPDCLLKRWTSREVFKLDAVRAAFPDAVPHELLQLAFPLLDPKALVTRYRSLYERAGSQRFVAMFQALDLWTKDGQPIPAAFLEEVIRDLYWDNRLYRGDYSVSGRRVRLDRFQGPVLNLYAQGDNIVPPASAKVLHELMPQADSRQLPTGHVTAVVGLPARKDTYDAVAEFVRSAQKSRAEEQSRRAEQKSDR